ncbi:hypothetical protein LINPERPRIM_LOCUS5587 [Linum perenne]
MAGNARQVNSQIESLSSHVERRLIQVFDVVNKNQTDFQELRKILTTPFVQSRALPPDGLGSMSNDVGNVSPHSTSGRNGQPRPDVEVPPRAYPPPPIPPQVNRHGMDPAGFMPPPRGQPPGVHDNNNLRE